MRREKRDNDMTTSDSRKRKRHERREAMRSFLVQSVEDAKRYLKRMPERPNIETIAMVVARSFCVDIKTMKTTLQRTSAALAGRQVAMALACANGFTQEEVGKAFDRSQFAVHVAVGKYAKLVDDDACACD